MEEKGLESMEMGRAYAVFEREVDKVLIFAISLSTLQIFVTITTFFLKKKETPIQMG